MKWTIPAGTIIGSGQFLVIWGSTKNRGTATTPLHTGFGYANGTPEPVVLSRPVAGGGATIVDRFAVGTTANYGPQRPDVSFGRYPSPEGLKTGYMPVPTPGENGSRGPVGMHNCPGFAGFTAPPVFGGSTPGIRGSGSVTATLTAPAGGGTLHFTTNAAEPSTRSELYAGPLVAERTAIIRAIAVKDGHLPSASVTRSFIHKDDILGTSPQGTVPADHQGARDLAGAFTGRLRGSPEATSEGASFPLLYGMNPQAIAARRDAIAASLVAAPVVSLVCPVSRLFEVASGGLYANSGETDGTAADPLDRDWERACSFEIIEPGASVFTQANAALEITGASSIFNNTTRKHNLRIRFDETYGQAVFEYPLFPGFAGDEFVNFHLKNTSQDSWAIAGGNDPAARDAATYCREGWVAATHRAMGHEAPHSRWSHLFLNGIYWGAYQIIERADDGFMDAHFGPGDYDIIRQPGVVVSGDAVARQGLNAAAEAVRDAPAAGKPTAYAALGAQLDLRNFIDYLICNSYAFNNDWPWNNWRAGRRKVAGERWRFFVWDAEASLQQGQETLSASSFLLSSTNDGPEFLHSCLKGYQLYRDLFSARLRWHFEDHSSENPVNHPQGHPSTSGTLMLSGIRSVLTRFQAEMAKFEPLVHAESSRWGDMAKVVPYAKSDPAYLPGLSRGDWDRATNHVLDVWLPTRQSHYLSDMQAAGLYQP